MSHLRFFPDHIQSALQHTPPGAWMPNVTKECIRFSAGYPAPDLVPSEEIARCVNTLVVTEGDLPFQYLGSPNMAELPVHISNRLQSRGMTATPNEVLVTAGACQAIDLIARILLDETSVILVEEPTYMEALEVFQNYTSHIHSVPMDDEGIQTDVLASYLRGLSLQNKPIPRLLYTIPSFQNPTGTTMSARRRQHLVALAHEYDFMILEDDAYGELWFHDAPVPLKSLEERGGFPSGTPDSHVIYVGSLSKVVAPGMRVGWIYAAEELIQACSWFKKDLEHAFSHATTSLFLQSCDFERRLNTLRSAYRQRRDAMVASLERHMPPSVTWRAPEGGFFIWLQAQGTDTVNLLPRVLSQGVSYVPGRYFYSNPSIGREFLRLSFSFLSLEEMEQGIRILGQVFHTYQ